jgi:two-component system CheB/CheR fusion protein
VDDNPDGAETMAMLLQVAGHEVQTAGDGDTAISAALAFHPEMVLLDIGLPGKDGYHVAMELRSRPETRAALLIVVSGYGQEEDRRRAKAAGIDHYFTKPVDIESLLKLLSGEGGKPGLAWPEALRDSRSFVTPKPEAARPDSLPR